MSNTRIKCGLPFIQSHYFPETVRSKNFRITVLVLGGMAIIAGITLRLLSYEKSGYSLIGGGGCIAALASMKEVRIFRVVPRIVPNEGSASTSTVVSGFDPEKDDPSVLPPLEDVGDDLLAASRTQPKNDAMEKIRGSLSDDFDYGMSQEELQRVINQQMQMAGMGSNEVEFALFNLLHFRGECTQKLHCSACEDVFPLPPLSSASVLPTLSSKEQFAQAISERTPLVDLPDCESLTADKMRAASSWNEERTKQMKEEAAARRARAASAPQTGRSDSDPHQLKTLRADMERVEVAMGGKMAFPAFSLSETDYMEEANSIRSFVQVNDAKILQDIISSIAFYKVDSDKRYIAISKNEKGAVVGLIVVDFEEGQGRIKYKVIDKSSSEEIKVVIGASLEEAARAESDKRKKPLIIE